MNYKLKLVFYRVLHWCNQFEIDFILSLDFKDRNTDLLHRLQASQYDLELQIWKLSRQL